MYRSVNRGSRGRPASAHSGQCGGLVISAMGIHLHQMWMMWLGSGMAIIYVIFMVSGAPGYRIPPTGWKPGGWTEPVKHANNAMITNGHEHVKRVWGIP